MEKLQFHRKPYDFEAFSLPKIVTKTRMSQNPHKCRRNIINDNINDTNSPRIEKIPANVQYSPFLTPKKCDNLDYNKSKKQKRKKV